LRAGGLMIYRSVHEIAGKRNNVAGGEHPGEGRGRRGSVAA